MPRTFSQPTHDNRLTIESLRAQGSSMRCIASALNVSPSTVSREIARAAGKSSVWYLAVRGQRARRHGHAMRCELGAGQALEQRHGMARRQQPSAGQARNSASHDRNLHADKATSAGPAARCPAGQGAMPQHRRKQRQPSGMATQSAELTRPCGCTCPPSRLRKPPPRSQGKPPTPPPCSGRRRARRQ